MTYSKLNAQRIAVVGATGAVGRTLVELLEQSEFPLGQLRLIASAASVGVAIPYQGSACIVQPLSRSSLQGQDIIFFCTSSELAKAWVPIALESGATVIDKSPYFRMQPDVPLVVPEINGAILSSGPQLIASPNCSAIIALMGLWPLHRAFGLKSFIACTYQSASGAGMSGIQALENELQGRKGPSPFPMPIAYNAIAQIGMLHPNGQSDEELKMREESLKILDIPGLKVAATCVRIPTLRSHMIAIHASFERPVSVKDATDALSEASGIQITDTPNPIDASQQKNCYVGRIRLDTALPNGLCFVATCDQLLKGAALNALQIAERLTSDRLRQ